MKSLWDKRFWIGLALVLTVVALASYVVFPEWKDTPWGWIRLPAAVLVGTVPFIRDWYEAQKLKAETEKLKVETKKLTGELDQQPITKQKTELEVERLLARDPLEEIPGARVLVETGENQVPWVDRNFIQPGDLSRYRPLLIYGRMKLGKTREAWELIRRKEFKGKLYGLNIDNIKQLGVEAVRKAVENQIDPHQEALVFVDELAYHFNTDELPLLTEVFAGLKSCPHTYILATAREDQISASHREWFSVQDFLEAEMLGLTADQVRSLVEKAQLFYSRDNKIQIDVNSAAQQIFVERSDGTPELILNTFQNLIDRQEEYVSYGRDGRKQLQINGEIAGRVVQYNLENAWRDTRQYLKQRYPLSEFLLEAMGCFYQYRVDMYGPLVDAFSLELHRLSHPEQELEDANNRLEEAKLALEVYQIREADGVYRPKDIAIESLSDLHTRCTSLIDFLGKPSRERLNLLKLISLIGLGNQVSQEDAIGYLDLAVGLQESLQQSLTEEKLGQAGWHNQLLAIAFNNRGNSYAALDQHARAIQDFDDALRLDPDAVAYYNRGTEYLALGQHERAIQDFDDALRLNPDFAAAYSNRGNRYAALGQHERAIQDYDDALRLNPEYAAAYSNRGNSYAALGQHERAIQDFDDALRLDPQNMPAVRNRAESFIKLNRLEEAERDCQLAEMLDPLNAYTHARFGQLFLAKKEYLVAEARFRNASELADQPLDYAFDLGLALIAQGKTAAGLDLFRARLGAFDYPEDLDAMLALAEKMTADMPESTGLMDAIQLMKERQHQRDSSS